MQICRTEQGTTEVCAIYRSGSPTSSHSSSRLRRRKGACRSMKRNTIASPFVKAPVFLDLSADEAMEYQHGTAGWITTNQAKFIAASLEAAAQSKLDEDR